MIPNLLDLLYIVVTDLTALEYSSKQKPVLHVDLTIDTRKVCEPSIQSKHDTKHVTLWIPLSNKRSAQVDLFNLVLDSSGFSSKKFIVEGQGWNY